MNLDELSMQTSDIVNRVRSFFSSREELLHLICDFVRMGKFVSASRYPDLDSSSSWLIDEVMHEGRMDGLQSLCRHDVCSVDIVTISLPKHIHDTVVIEGFVELADTFSSDSDACSMARNQPSA